MSFSIALSGKCGDIIYELAGVSALAKLRNQRADVWLLQNDGISLTAQEVQSLLPLIRSQLYVASAETWDGKRPDVDVTDWFMNYDHANNIVRDLLGWLEVDLDEGRREWLTVDVPENGFTLVNKTSRYCNPAVQWPAVIDEHPHAQFIGLPHEWEAFQKLIQRKVGYFKTADFLEVGRAIGGCSLFLGNQSAPLATAHGLHRPVLVETSHEYPNCVFVRPNARYLGIDESFVEKHGY